MHTGNLFWKTSSETSCSYANGLIRPGPCPCQNTEPFCLLSFGGTLKQMPFSSLYLRCDNSMVCIRTYHMYYVIIKIRRTGLAIKTNKIRNDARRPKSQITHHFVKKKPQEGRCHLHGHRGREAGEEERQVEE